MQVTTKPIERISDTLPLTARVKRGIEVVEESRLQKKTVWGEGLSILDKETIKLPLVKRKALAIKKILSEMPIEIKDYELIVGLVNLCSVKMASPIPEYATKEEIEKAKKKFTGPRAIFGHMSPYYPRFLKLGISGLRKITEDKLAEVRYKNKDSGKEAWYEAVLISLDGLKNLIQRYGELASTIAAGEADEKRKEELDEIAQICFNLAERPPQTFREALQAFWFAGIGVNSVGYMSAFGRFDQNLWPFLKRDLENGTITRDEAQELVDLLWLKFNERLQLLELIKTPDDEDTGKLVEARNISGSRRLTGGSPFLGGKTSLDRFGLTGGHYNQFWQTMGLSGLTPEGKDGTNPLTYIAMNATYRLKFVQPEMYLRLHKKSPPELFKRAADLIRNGLVNPSIYNDEAVIPAFVKEGIPIEVARDYTPDGCYEAHPQGQVYFKYNFLSCLECLDRTLSPASWWEELEVPGYMEEFDPFKDVKVPDPYSYHSFDEVMDTFKKLFDIFIRAAMESVAMMRDGRIYDIAPLPLFSALVEGPLESGRDLTREEGGMQYRQHSLMLRGLSHTADSLAVIKKLCFEEKIVNWVELLDAIGNNWEGKESLRQLVRTRSPAYGNDIDYVDNIAGGIVEFFVERIRKHRAEMGTKIIFCPGIGTFGNYAAMGYVIGATVDGRLAKTPISSNTSPSVGRAMNGQTAAVNSYLKLPHTDLPTGAALDLAIAKRIALLPQVEALIRTFVEGKGNLLTVSVNDVEMLRAAQREPEKYRDLKIRMGGWEAYFVDLPRVQQEWQIQKAEQYA